jgi:hypothetical protein
MAMIDLKIASSFQSTQSKAIQLFAVVSLRTQMQGILWCYIQKVQYHTLSVYSIGIRGLLWKTCG